MPLCERKVLNPTEHDRRPTGSIEASPERERVNMNLTGKLSHGGQSEQRSQTEALGGPTTAERREPAGGVSRGGRGQAGWVVHCGAGVDTPDRMKDGGRTPHREAVRRRAWRQHHALLQRRRKCWIGIDAMGIVGSFIRRPLTLTSSRVNTILSFVYNFVIVRMHFSTGKGVLSHARLFPFHPKNLRSQNLTRCTCWNLSLSLPLPLSLSLPLPLPLPLPLSLSLIHFCLLPAYPTASETQPLCRSQGSIRGRLE